MFYVSYTIIVLYEFNPLQNVARKPIKYFNNILNNIFLTTGIVTGNVNLSHFVTHTHIYRCIIFYKDNKTDKRAVPKKKRQRRNKSLSGPVTPWTADPEVITYFMTSLL